MDKKTTAIGKPFADLADEAKAINKSIGRIQSELGKLTDAIKKASPTKKGHL